MENYFESQRDHIFRGVEVLIYVFDVESREKAVRAFISRLNVAHDGHSDGFHLSG